MFKELPRGFATIYWRDPNLSSKAWTFNQAFAADTMQEAAQLAENVQKGMAPRLEYRILCGGYTHMVQPPEPVKLTLISLRD